MNITITSSELNTLFGYASDIVNALMPIALLVGGIGLGFVVFGKLVGALRGGG